MQPSQPNSEYTIPEHDSGVVEDVTAFVSDDIQPTEPVDIFAKLDKAPATERGPRPELVPLLSTIPRKIEALRDQVA